MTSSSPQEPVSESAIPAPLDQVQIAAPHYLRNLKLHLQAEEPELWSWFVESSAKADAAEDSGAEVELMKTAIRLEGGPYASTTAQARLLAARLGLEEEIIVYQSLDDDNRNASVMTFGGKIHILFSGNMLELLEDAELRTVLLHELAHIVLWRLEDGDYRVLDAMIHRLADESTDTAVAESARRVRLHTEVWADSVALLVLNDLPTVVTTLMKTSSGLRHVDPEAYLRQAERILAQDQTTTSAQTHPEHHLRVACLALPADAPDRNDQIAWLVEGPDDLDTVDLLGQLRLQSLVAQVLVAGESALGEAAVAPGVQAYLGSYPRSKDRPSAPVDGALSQAQPSVRHLAAALLVDLCMANDSLGGLGELRSVSKEADRLGISTEFDKVLGKATDRTVAEARRLRDVAPQ